VRDYYFEELRDRRVINQDIEEAIKNISINIYIGKTYETHIDFFSAFYDEAIPANLDYFTGGIFRHDTNNIEEQQECIKMDKYIEKILKRQIVGNINIQNDLYQKCIKKYPRLNYPKNAHPMYHQELNPIIPEHLELMKKLMNIVFVTNNIIKKLFIQRLDDWTNYAKKRLKSIIIDESSEIDESSVINLVIKKYGYKWKNEWHDSSDPNSYKDFGSIFKLKLSELFKYPEYKKGVFVFFGCRSYDGYNFLSEKNEVIENMRSIENSQRFSLTGYLPNKCEELICSGPVYNILGDENFNMLHGDDYCKSINNDCTKCQKIQNDFDRCVKNEEVVVYISDDISILSVEDLNEILNNKNPKEFNVNTFFELETYMQNTYSDLNLKTKEGIFQLVNNLLSKKMSPADKLIFGRCLLSLKFENDIMIELETKFKKYLNDFEKYVINTEESRTFLKVYIITFILPFKYIEKEELCDLLSEE